MDLQGLLSPDTYGFGARMKLIKARAGLGCRAKSRQRMEGNWEPKLGTLVQAEEEGRWGWGASQPVSSLPLASTLSLAYY